MPDLPKPAIPRTDEPTSPAILPAMKRAQQQEALTKPVAVGELPSGAREPDPKPWNEVLAHLGKMEERRRADTQHVVAKIDDVAVGQKSLAGDVASLGVRVKKLEEEIHETNSVSPPAGLSSIPVTYIPQTPPPPSIPQTPSAFTRQASGADLALARDLGTLMATQQQMLATLATQPTRADVEASARAAAKAENDVQLAAVMAKLDSWGNSKWGTRIVAGVSLVACLMLGWAAQRLQGCTGVQMTPVAPVSTSR